MERGIRVRPITDDDWDGILALEAGAYTALGLSEGRAALESKVWASPATCFAMEVGPRLAGYLLALPYPESAYPDLTRREEVVFRSRNLHLHDLVVADDLRGRGLGKHLLGRLTACAEQQGYQQVSLVAVGGSHGFWSANGFTARDGVVNSPGYGPGSVYMSLALPSAQGGNSAPVGGLLGGTPSQHEVGQA